MKESRYLITADGRKLRKDRMSPTARIRNRKACREYYQRNREKMREKNRAWREANPEYSRIKSAEYLKKHPSYYYEYNKDRRMRLKEEKV